MRRASAELEPNAAASVTPSPQGRTFPTGWARLAPVRAVREVVQVVGVKNVLRKELALEVFRDSLDPSSAAAGATNAAVPT